MFDKIKELTKDTVIYGISTIVGRFLNFLLVPFYTNVFEPRDVGIYSNIYAYIAFLNVVFIYGMDAAFMKYNSAAADKDKKLTYSTAYLFLTITSLILSALLYLGKDGMIRLMEIPNTYEHLYNYLIFIILFDTLAIVPFANLRLQRKSLKFTLIKLGNISLNILLNLVLVLKLKMDIEAIFIANLAASAFSFIVLLPDIYKNFEFRIDGGYLKLMLKFAIPYLPASMAATLVQVVDRPIVLALTDEKTLGIYQASYKLGIFMMLIVQMFQFAWQPFLLINSKEENAKEIFSKVLTLFLIAASLMWIVLSLFIEDIATIRFWGGVSLIGYKYWSGLAIVPIILLAYIFHGMYVNFQAGLYIEEKTKYFPIVTGSGALVNIVSNFLLIPFWGIMGAALATLFSYITMALALFYFSQKVYRIKYEYGKIARLMSLIFSATVAYYLLYYNGILNIPVKILLLFVFVTILFIAKIVDINELSVLTKRLVKRK
ncbi:polysaccharide biosynthesis protein [Melioribacter roseus P3M-2]|uniref:Polysaccharide biosynthesis protein n=1 Tax=Melioribacter roseus (strain DSM 23840 / JCM 17771 / VKM B-2668 / P3M-2) TaxID=1191523 RepID=I7A0P7_MELRP|nr:polysaccharide biosynthesis C-terminal domain-containing protein [Melioribacter roseus]AFN73536.1 polysaccharide biosynthesis protein [Melioribacter roseus P3M-2]